MSSDDIYRRPSTSGLHPTRPAGPYPAAAFLRGSVRRHTVVAKGWCRAAPARKPGRAL